MPGWGGGHPERFYGVHLCAHPASPGILRTADRLVAMEDAHIAGFILTEEIRRCPTSVTLDVAEKFRGGHSMLRRYGDVMLRAMNAKHITPILNVSDIAASFAWFAKWGWRKCWDWGTPATFGAVGSGEIEIFLCQGAQGGRGKGMNTTTFQKDGDEAGDKGAWMSVWVDDVDEVYRQCVGAGLDVTFPPTDMPWNVREMHVRHPDGHVFRVSKGIEKG